MIYITREAKQELKRLLAGNKRTCDMAWRIIDKGKGKLKLVPDSMRPHDEVVEFEGKILLVVERGLVSGQKNISLDAYTAADMQRIVISEEDVTQLSSSVTVNWMSFPQSS
jgi:hypothetical protein